MMLLAEYGELCVKYATLVLLHFNDPRVLLTSSVSAHLVLRHTRSIDEVSVNRKTRRTMERSGGHVNDVMAKQ